MSTFMYQFNETVPNYTIYIKTKLFIYVQDKIVLRNL